jgi:hypothetical protein
VSSRSGAVHGPSLDQRRRASLIDLASERACCDKVVVRVQLGGIARHTGITMEFELYHVIQYHDAKVTRLEAHIPRADALGAAGLSSEG